MTTLRTGPPHSPPPSHQQRFARYTTFGPGELEAHLRERLNLSPDEPVPQPVSRMVRTHRFAVTYPDAQHGTCEYERLGPAWHRFRFTYGTQPADIAHAATNDRLPVQNSLERLTGGIMEVEIRGQELAARSYEAAIEQERRDRFARASAPFWAWSPSPKGGVQLRNNAPPQLSVRRAKTLGGRYALCLTLSGGALLPAQNVTYATLAEANAAWRDKKDHHQVVACCCRWNRRWELPRFNPLYKEHDPRPGHEYTAPATAAAEGGTP